MQPLAREAWRGLLAGRRVDVAPGLRLLDSNDAVVDDLTTYLEAGTVSRSGDDMGTCTLRLARELDWGADRVQPYVTVSNDVTSLSASLGVYLLTTPRLESAEAPARFDVQGYDKLLILDSAVPRTPSYATGTNALTTVRSLIAEAGGGTRVLFGGQAASVTLPAGKSWQLGATYLTVINELLATVGYEALWCDWDGAYRSGPIVPPENRAPEWTYDADDPRTTVGADGSSHGDFWRAPNHWIVIADNPGLSVPTEGNGLVHRRNRNVGKASIAARRRELTTVVRKDAANQAALEAQADKVLADALRPDLKWSGSTVPNPLHWHRDVVALTHDALNLAAQRFLVWSWTFDLFGGDMRHSEWQAL